MDWPYMGAIYLRTLQRLENPVIDGADLEEQEGGAFLIPGIGKTGLDITKKSEEWIRGYYEILMGVARSAEQLDGWVLDRSRNMKFPKDRVIGPSNPKPKPMFIKLAAPKEEDCEPAFDGPEVYYVKALTTLGFTDKQRMDAALAYAEWLDYKKSPDAALEMCKWALDIAAADSPIPVLDSVTGVLNDKAGRPSANILAATTALAVHHAQNSDLTAALPIFLSILRARKSLRDPPRTMLSLLAPGEEQEDDGYVAMVRNFVKNMLISPPYPPPPDDGKSPPERDARERCEEAGIMAYIGEIFFASKGSKTSKEEALAWTREAVDIAEEEMRARSIDKEAKKVCKACLQVGLTNWSTMVAKMAQTEKEKPAEKSGSGWLAFGAASKEVAGRWESEEKVVLERARRAKEILEPTPPQSIWSALSWGIKHS
jgi:hypothetical protein